MSASHLIGRAYGTGVNRRFIDLTGVPPQDRLPLVEDAAQHLCGHTTAPPAEGPVTVSLGVHRVDPLALREVSRPLGVTLTLSPHPHVLLTPAERVEAATRAARGQLSSILRMAMNHLSGPVEVRLHMRGTEP